jgi:hypothetical protein
LKARMHIPSPCRILNLYNTLRKYGGRQFVLWINVNKIVNLSCNYRFCIDFNDTISVRYRKQIIYNFIRTKDLMNSSEIEEMKGSTFFCIHVMVLFVVFVTFDPVFGEPDPSFRASSRPFTPSNETLQIQEKQNCYIDLTTLQRLLGPLDHQRQLYSNMLSMIQNGYVSHIFPFYETRYHSENINTLESLLTILALVEVNQQKPESIVYLRE